MTPLGSFQAMHMQEQSAANQRDSEEEIKARQILAARLTPHQNREAKIFTQGAFNPGKARHFFVSLIENGLAYELSFQAVQDFCGWMREGKSYDQSAILVSEKLHFQTPAIERILLARFMTDMMMSSHEPDAITAENEDCLNNLMRRFFENCSMSFEERWQFIEEHMKKTEGMKFDDRLLIAFFAIDSLKRFSINQIAAGVEDILTLMRDGLSFKAAAVVLDKRYRAQHTLAA